MANKWIGVDLDKTLATFDKWRGENHIGEPIPAMVDKINQARENGKNVKIFTARASDPAQIPYIERWLKQNGLGGLEITNQKDYDMEEIWDDKAIQVDPNTGEFTLTITDDVDGRARKVTYTPSEVAIAEQFGHNPEDVYLKTDKLQKFDDDEDLTEEQIAKRELAHKKLSKLKNYDELGLKPEKQLVMYVAKMDDKCRDEHKALNGNVYQQNSKPMCSCDPPSDMNCRCEMKPVDNTDKRITNVVLSDYYHQEDKEQVPMNDIKQVSLADEKKEISYWDNPKYKIDKNSPLGKIKARAIEELKAAEKLMNTIPLQPDSNTPQYSSIEEWEKTDLYGKYADRAIARRENLDKILKTVERFVFIWKRMKDIALKNSTDPELAGLFDKIYEDYSKIYQEQKGISTKALINLIKREKDIRFKYNLRKKSKDNALTLLSRIKQLTKERRNQVKEFEKDVIERVQDLKKPFILKDYSNFQIKSRELAKPLTEEEKQKEKERAKLISSKGKFKDEKRHWNKIKNRFREVVQYLLTPPGKKDEAKEDMLDQLNAKKEIFNALMKSTKIETKNKNLIRNLNTAIIKNDIAGVLAIGARLGQAAEYADGDSKNALKLYRRISTHEKKIADEKAKGRKGKEVPSIDKELTKYAKTLKKADKGIIDKEGVVQKDPDEVVKKKEKKIRKGKEKKSTLTSEYKAKIQDATNEYNAALNRKGIGRIEEDRLKEKFDKKLATLKEAFKAEVRKIPKRYSKQQKAVDRRNVEDWNKEAQWVQDNIKPKYQKKIMSLYSFEQMRNDSAKIKETYPEAFILAPDEVADPIERMADRLKEKVKPTDLKAILDKKAMVTRGDGTPVYNLTSNDIQIIKSEIDRNEIKSRSDLQERLVGINQDKSVPKGPEDLGAKKKALIAEIEKHEDNHYIAEWMPSKAKWIDKVNKVTDLDGLSRLNKYFNSAMAKAMKTKTYKKGKRAADMTDEELLAETDKARKKKLLKEKKEYVATEKVHQGTAVREAVRAFVSGRLDKMNRVDRERHMATLNTSAGASALNKEVKRRRQVAEQQGKEPAIPENVRKLNEKLNKIFSAEGKKEFVSTLGTKPEPKKVVTEKKPQDIKPKPMDANIKATRDRLLGRLRRASPEIGNTIYRKFRNEAQKAQTLESINIIVQKLNKALKDARRKKASRSKEMI